MTFTLLPDQIPAEIAELEGLAAGAKDEIHTFLHRPADELSEGDVDRLEYLVASFIAVDRALVASVAPPPVPAPPKSDMRTAIHEAAHAAVSVLVGAEVDAAEVFPNGATLPNGAGGYCRYAPFSYATKQRNHVITAAGAVAEAVYLHGGWPTSTQIDALLVGTLDGDELRRRALTAGASSSRSPGMEALPLVLRCWPAIAKLAADMDVYGACITHADVTEALGLSSDQSRHPFEIANIHAGLRAVPIPAVPQR